MKRLILISAIAVLSACNKPAEDRDLQNPNSTSTTTLETSGVAKAVTAYVNTPGAETEAGVNRALADLDKEIAELEERSKTATGPQQAEARAKADELRDYRTKERARYEAARVKAGLSAAGDRVKEVGEAMKDTAKDAANSVRDAVR